MKEIDENTGPDVRKLSPRVYRKAAKILKRQGVKLRKKALRTLLKTIVHEALITGVDLRLHDLSPIAGTIPTPPITPIEVKVCAGVGSVFVLCVVNDDHEVEVVAEFYEGQLVAKTWDLDHLMAYPDLPDEAATSSVLLTRDHIETLSRWKDWPRCAVCQKML